MKAFIAFLFSFASLAHAAEVPARTIELTVDGLVCAFCAQGIDKKMRKLDATADVYVSLEQHLVAVALKPGQDIADEKLGEVLTEAGYTLRGAKRVYETLDAVRARVEKK
jgi:copper chaperone CopZ